MLTLDRGALWKLDSEHKAVVQLVSQVARDGSEDLARDHVGSALLVSWGTFRKTHHVADQSRAFCLSLLFSRDPHIVLLCTHASIRF